MAGSLSSSLPPLGPPPGQSVPKEIKQSGNRLGRAWFLVGVSEYQPISGPSMEYTLVFMKCDGDETTVTPHMVLLKLYTADQKRSTGEHFREKIVPERFLPCICAGGGIVLHEGRLYVGFKSGLYQFGKGLKDEANNISRDKAMEVRDLAAVGVCLATAELEIAERIWRRWHEAEETLCYEKKEYLSEAAMSQIFNARDKLAERFVLEFGINPLPLYRDALNGEQFEERIRYFKPRGPPVSLLPPDTLRPLLTQLTNPSAIEKLIFRDQKKLMTTPDSGVAMAEVMRTCPNLHTLSLANTGMTVAAFNAMASAMPVMKGLNRLTLSGNRELIEHLSSKKSFLNIMFKNGPNNDIAVVTVLAKMPPTCAFFFPDDSEDLFFQIP